MSELNRNFIGFVQRGKEVLPLLPFIYTMNVYFFEEILGERVICRRMCGVYKKKVVLSILRKTTLST